MADSLEKEDNPGSSDSKAEPNASDTLDGEDASGNVSDRSGEESEPGGEEKTPYLITKNFPLNYHSDEGFRLIKITKSSRDILLETRSRDNVSNKKVEVTVETYSSSSKGNVRDEMKDESRLGKKLLSNDSQSGFNRDSVKSIIDASRIGEESLGKLLSDGSQSGFNRESLKNIVDATRIKEEDVGLGKLLSESSNSGFNRESLKSIVDATPDNVDKRVHIKVESYASKRNLKRDSSIGKTFAGGSNTDRAKSENKIDKPDTELDGTVLADTSAPKSKPCLPCTSNSKFSQKADNAKELFEEEEIEVIDAPAPFNETLDYGDEMFVKASSKPKENGTFHSPSSKEKDKFESRSNQDDKPFNAHDSFIYRTSCTCTRVGNDETNIKDHADINNDTNGNQLPNVSYTCRTLVGCERNYEDIDCPCANSCTCKTIVGSERNYKDVDCPCANSCTCKTIVGSEKDYNDVDCPCANSCTCKTIVSQSETDDAQRSVICPCGNSCTCKVKDAVEPNVIDENHKPVCTCKANAEREIKYDEKKIHYPCEDNCEGLDGQKKHYNSENQTREADTIDQSLSLESFGNPNKKPTRESKRSRNRRKSKNERDHIDLRLSLEAFNNRNKKAIVQSKASRNRRKAKSDNQKETIVNIHVNKTEKRFENAQELSMLLKTIALLVTTVSIAILATALLYAIVRDTSSIQCKINEGAFRINQGVSFKFEGVSCFKFLHGRGDQSLPDDLEKVHYRHILQDEITRLTVDRIMLDFKIKTLLRQFSRQNRGKYYDY